MYILVAEDDHFLGNAYRVKLEKEGFEVEVVANGEDVISRMKKRVPDLILLDLVMPVMDGFATLKSVRVVDAWKKIPIIVASNLGQQEDIDKATALGATDFVIKTNISLDEIIKKVKALV